MRDWFTSRKFVFFIFAAITSVICVGVFNIELGVTTDSKNDVFTIEFDYYGMDSAKIEKIITIPLEHKLLGMEGLLELNSSSEYGKSITTAYFKKSKNTKNIYLAIRNIVDGLYQNLPKDVQKPRIYSSDINSKSMLSIAFYQNEDQKSLRDKLESNLKKKLEAVEGVSEVIVTGGLQKEILVSFNPEKSAASLQNPGSFSSAIQDANSVTGGSEFIQANRNISIQFNTKIKDIDELAELPLRVGDGFTKLKFLADVSFSNRENEELVRIDGKEAVVLSIKADSNGNSIKISNAVHKILKNYRDHNFEYKILYDEGSKQLELIKNVLISLLESLICVFLIIPIFYKSLRTTCLILSLLCINSLWTVGILQFLGFTLNQNTIAGLSIALGLIADPVLVIAEKAEICRSSRSFIKSIYSVFPSLVSAGITTMLVLIPLSYLDTIVPGTKVIAITIGIMILSSLVLSMFFIPPFIYERKILLKFDKRSSFIAKISKFYIKLGYICSFISIRNKKIAAALFISFTVLPFLIFVLSGKNISIENTSNILYCSLDYESEISSTYIDKELMKLVHGLEKAHFINFVRTECRKGSADIEIGFSNCSRQHVAQYVSSFSKLFPDAFLYVPEISSRKKTKRITALQISCIGDESEICRQYCEEAVKLLNTNSYCSSVVLNFKRNENEYIFIPDREKCIKNNITVQTLASSLRWYMFGPVADKWISDGSEYDIRIAGSGLIHADLEKIENLHIPSQNTTIRMSTLGQIELVPGNGKIYRKNGRRCAYFTVEIADLSTDKAIACVKETLKKIEMKRGYGFSFSREAEEISENYRLIFSMLLISICAIFILLTFLTEKILRSLVIISIIPVSLMMPLVIKMIMGIPLELGDIVGMVVLSGITVNNSIYLAESKKMQIYNRVREKIKSILVTSLTTIAGAVPLYLISSNSFSKSLAFFMIFGILNSFAAALLIFPGILHIYYEKYEKIQ